jgi:hypothetical protein
MKPNKAYSIYSASEVGLLLLVLFLYQNTARAQETDSLRHLPPRDYQMEIGTQVIATSKGLVPFWMRSNRNGSIPLDGMSGSITASLIKNFHEDTSAHRGFDWGGGIAVRVNTGNKAEIIPIEAFVKAKYNIIQARIGRFKDINGIVDSTLSLGAFSVSNNALGIPQLEIGIPEYWSIPYTKGLIALKGSISHGWFGTYELRSQTQFVNEAEAYYHQKSLYGRIGKPSWKVRIYGGINHQVMWGNERKIFGPAFELSNFQSFTHVFFGKAYGNNTVPTSKIGNQLGSIDQMLEADLNGVRLTGYHQFFYDIGGLYHLTNLRDGLWGLSVANTKKDAPSISWEKFLVEFLYSRSQGGEIDSKPTPSGAEDYYNNFLYYKGWSYRDENIGNPLFTSKKYLRSELPHQETEYFGNNRIAAFHIGGLFNFYDWKFKTLLTFSSNYGTYATAPAAKSVGGRIVYNDPPYFQKVNQFSGLLEIDKPIWKQRYRLGLVLAVDNGELLYNSFGGGIKLSRKW